MLSTERIAALLGREHDMESVARELRRWVQEMEPTTVGAMLLTCSDESEQEVADTFHKAFANHVLPELKFAARFPFRSANLGAPRPGG